MTTAQITALTAELVTGKLTFTAGVLSNGGAQTIGFSYDASAADLDFLRAGDTLTIGYAVQVSDGHVTTLTQPLNFVVSGTNDAPVVDLDSGTAGNDATGAFTEQTPLVIAPSATITDVDSANLTSLTATLTARPDGNTVESLSLNAAATAAAAGLTVSYTPSTGVLSVTGSASKATYQTIMDGIVYNDTSDTPTTTSRTVNVVVNDGTDPSLSHSVTISVAAVNDPPVVDLNGAGVGSNATASFTEQTPLVIAPSATITDVDSANLTSLTATLTARPDGNTVESLSLNAAATAAAAGLTVSYTPSTGVLSVTGSASKATYQTIMDGIVYNDTSNTPTTTSRTVNVVVNDGTDPSLSQSVTISVAAVNDAPLTDLNGAGVGSNATASFIGTPVLIAPSGTVSDVDSPNLAAMTVTLTNHPDGSAESLSLNTAAAALVTADHLTRSYNSSTGVLSITGSASQADYQTILEGISYNDTSVAPNTTDRTVTVVVSDGTLSSTSNSVTIGVNPHVTIAAGTVYQLNGGTLQGSLIDVEGEIEGNGTVTGVNGTITSIVDNGTLEGFPNTLFFLNGNITGTGVLELINPNTTMELGGSVASTLSVMFDGSSGSKLILDDPAGFHAPISGFGGTDVIDARTMLYSSATSTVLSSSGTVSVGTETITRSTDHTSTTITLSEGATTATFTLLGNYTGRSFTFSSDGSGGTKFVDPIVVDSGATLDLQGVSWDSVMFLNNGGYGTLVLENPSTYTGQIFGFTGTDPQNSDLIDLQGIIFDAGTSWTYADNAGSDTGGTLTVFETINGVATAVDSISFANGDYITANFKLASDGHGGTLIADPPAGSGTATQNGTIENTGVIELSSTPDLQLIQTGATLHGGGQIVLSDNDANVISGTSASVTLNNEDNTISGAGQLGNGELSLTNSGTINATGTHALVIDTGSNFVSNFGILEASGSGGLTVASAVANLGVLWANGANLTVHGDVSGNGTAIIDGSGTVDFGAASSANVVFGSGSAGLLKLEDSFHFNGTISGLKAAATIDLTDVNSATASIAYHENIQGTGGVLTVSDGTHAAQLSLLGHYSADNFQIVPDHVHGTLITAHYDLSA